MPRVSTRKYGGVLPAMAETAGVSRSSVSRQAIEASDLRPELGLCSRRPGPREVIFRPCSAVCCPAGAMRERLGPPPTDCAAGFGRSCMRESAMLNKVPTATPRPESSGPGPCYEPCANSATTSKSHPQSPRLHQRERGDFRGSFLSSRLHAVFAIEPELHLVTKVETT